MTDIHHNQLQTTLNDLMVKFNELPPIIEKNPTFLEITEYPHYENVCSNILRFYFDTSQPHGLKNLLLKSLLQAIDKDDLAEQITETTNVECEVRTKKSHKNLGRIDLVIECEDTIIAIENKIFHNLNNPLDSYKQHITEEYHSQTQRLFVILSISGINSTFINNDAAKNFKNIVYEKFFSKIKSNLGEFAMSANIKYLTYLMDFITSIENLTAPKNMDNSLQKFVAENENDILKINNIYDTVLKDIHEKIKKITKIDQTPKINIPLHTYQWIYAKRDIVHDVFLNQGTENEVDISIDCFFNINNIAIEIWVRKGINTDKLAFLNRLDFFKNNSPIRNSQINNRGYIVWESNEPYYLTKNETIITKLNEILPQIKIS